MQIHRTMGLERGIRRTIEYGVTIGLAVLFSYFIAQWRW
jgi:hypothetical protein